MNDDRPTLVVVGHGAKVPQGGAPLEALAARLAATGRFAAVHARFLRQEPRLGPIAALVPAGRGVVVPVMAGGGALADEEIPRLAGLAGPGRSDGRLRLTVPVGAHPGFADLVERRARAEAAAWGRPPATLALLLLAHGSSRGPAAGAGTLALARTLEGRGTFARVHAAFLEQAPAAADWRALAAGHPALALPLLLSAGGHARRDLPALFADGGATARLAPPIGDDPGLDALVTDLAARAFGPSEAT